MNRCQTCKTALDPDGSCPYNCKPPAKEKPLSPSDGASCYDSFVPFSAAWENEVMKSRKAEIVDMLKRAYRSRDFAMEENRRLLMGVESAAIRRHDDGRIELVNAPDVFACSRQFLEQLIARIYLPNV
jgi:hypothetical protein